MSQEAYEYVGKGLGLLKEGLTSFVEMRLESNLSGHWRIEVSDRISSIKNFVEDGKILWDVQSLLMAMSFFWKDAFSDLKHPVRSYMGEIRVARNNHAHQQNFTHEDADRALDTMCRLLKEIDKKEANVKEIIYQFDTLREEIKPITTEDDDSASPSHWKSYDLKVRR